MMNKQEFDFFQDHSERYLKMALSAARREAVRHPDGYGKQTSECGDTIELFLTVKDNRIRSVSCRVIGCINTNACANTVAELIEGKTVEATWKVDPEAVIDYLETLPPESVHCAELAVGALHRALAHYLKLRRDPWKKVYLNPP